MLVVTIASAVAALIMIIIVIIIIITMMGFLDGSVVKNLPTVQETWVWPLSWEDPLEESNTTHSRILAWRIPGTEKPGGL